MIPTFENMLLCFVAMNVLTTVFADEDIPVIHASAPSPWDNNDKNGIESGYTQAGNLQNFRTCYHSAAYGNGKPKLNQTAYLTIPLSEVTEVNLLRRFERKHGNDEKINWKGGNVEVCNGQQGSEKLADYECKECVAQRDGTIKAELGGERKWLPYKCPNDTKGDTIKVYHKTHFTIFCDVKITGRKIPSSVYENKDTTGDQDDGKDCNYKTSCDECIKASHRCNWCAHGSFDDVAFPGGRCSDKTTHCKDSSIIQVQSYINESESNEKVKTINLRDDEAFSFTVDVEPQPHIPFQIYFMLDGSRSMLRTLPLTKNYSKKLIKRVGEKWGKSTVGLGIFNDKEILPFTLTNVTDEKIHPNIELPFWKMVAKLTKDTSKFEDGINKVNIHYYKSPDNTPESHLDVVSQALTCKEKLGFRTNSDARHLIILATDAPFWVAGDGRFGGINTHPEGNCLGNTGEEQSEWSLRFDYPSVGFFKQLLEEKRVHILASVANYPWRQRGVFRQVSYAEINEIVYGALVNELSSLAEYIGHEVDIRRKTIKTVETNETSGSNETSPEKEGPEEQEEALKSEIYANAVMSKLEEISNQVSLVASGEDSKNFVIESFVFDEKCPGDSTPKLNNDGKIIACVNVAEGDKVKVRVVVKQKRGVKLARVNKFVLDLPGLHRKNGALLTVKIKHLDAKCDQEGKCKNIYMKIFPDYYWYQPITPDSEMCVYGTLECGTCVCEEGYHGKDCGCQTKTASDDPNVQQCKADTDASVICSGNGDCYCGECECSKNALGNAFVGKFCQCDPDACPIGDNGETCWGRGSCVCNEDTGNMDCKCDEDMFSHTYRYDITLDAELYPDGKDLLWKPIVYISINGEYDSIENILMNKTWKWNGPSSRMNFEIESNKSVGTIQSLNLWHDTTDHMLQFDWNLEKIEVVHGDKKYIFHCFDIRDYCKCNIQQRCGQRRYLTPTVQQLTLPTTTTTSQPDLTTAYPATTTGQDCKCHSSENCKDPNDVVSGEICNGRGKSCSCEGKCDCNDDFSGDYCEKCETASCWMAICHEPRYKDLILCKRANQKCDSKRLERTQINVVNYNMTDADAQINNWWKCAVAVNVTMGEQLKERAVSYYVNKKDIFSVALPAKKDVIQNKR